MALCSRVTALLFIQLEVEKKDVAERLEVMKQSNRDLNARLVSCQIFKVRDGLG